MAIDSAAKRHTAVDIGSPWRGVLPLPDGLIGVGDRGTILFLYNGIVPGGIPDLASANIRQSAICVSIPWRGGRFPVGTIAQAARQHIAHHYSGILALHTEVAVEWGWSPIVIQTLPLRASFVNAMSGPVYTEPPPAENVAELGWRPIFPNTIARIQTWAHLHTRDAVGALGYDMDATMSWTPVYPGPQFPVRFIFRPGERVVQPPQLVVGWWPQYPNYNRPPDGTVGQRPWHDPNFAWNTTTPAPGEDITLDKWWQPTSVPVRRQPFAQWNAAPTIIVIAEMPSRDLSWVAQLPWNPVLPKRTGAQYVPNPLWQAVTNWTIPDMVWVPTYPNWIARVTTHPSRMPFFNWYTETGLDVVPPLIVLTGHVMWAHPFISKYVKKMRQKNPW
jgi:hypothetical protein